MAYKTPGQTPSRCLAFLFGHYFAIVLPPGAKPVNAASKATAASEETARLPIYTSCVIEGRACPSWSATRRADSAASSRMVAAVFLKLCDVIHASVSVPRVSRSSRRTLSGSRETAEQARDSANRFPNHTARNRDCQEALSREAPQLVGMAQRHIRERGRSATP